MTSPFAHRALAKQSHSCRLQVFPKRYGARRAAKRLEVLADSRATVHFKIQQQVNFGDSHKIVGNSAELGKWDVQSAPAMSWSEGDVWTLEIEVPAESQLEFKCVKVNNNNAEWESCQNRVVQVPNGATRRVDVGFSWNHEGVEVAAESASEAIEEQKDEFSTQSSAEESTAQASEPASPDDTDDRHDHLLWQGRDITFMRSNQHSRDRQGVWDSSGLEGAAKVIVEGDEKGANWLSKMKVVKQVLVDNAGKIPDADALSNAFIYLQWINTGAIECKEGGGHYRPNKHAEIAREIFKSLERAIGEPKASPLLHLIARKTQTKLPSFTEEYTQSTPLTRIRDIAHRNDIPHELKQEIKHTIQNKLHRNAGPEDLVATEAMLKRITSEGGYSEDFVKEFKIFTAELRDFFNAGSFADMLGGIRPALDDQEQQGIDAFMEAKRKADEPAATKESLNNLVDALHSLTSVRATLLYKLSSGLRNDASDASIAMRQRFRLCEIRAEDYAFVLLSRILNWLEEQGGAERLSQGPDSKWALPLGAAVLGIRHVGLGGWQQQECMALENELGAWQQAGGFDQTEPALRLKASLERIQRLTQSFTDGLLDAFPARTFALGKALGIQQERIQVFTESEVRASLVFQLSKLCSLLLKAARISTGGAAWDALVAGEALGKLIEVDRIEAGAVDEVDQPVILLVKQASGDEEVGACGVNLKGVVLCHGLPHLSHLGVRARQEGVTFVACEDDSVVESEVRPLIGSCVALSVSSTSVSIHAAAEDAESNTSQAVSKQTASIKPSATKKVRKATVTPLEKAEVDICGSKSAACSHLTRLAAKSQQFKTAAGVCLPFGSMEAAIKESGKSQEFNTLLGELEGAEAKEGDLDSVCQKIQELIAAISPPTAILTKVGSSFHQDATVIVRSSANVEDLAGLSGAGLYDSIPNVPASNMSALASAIADVWASLFTRRAVLSRRAAGVSQKEASMAVLIQEQLAPELSFVLHTSSPLDKDDKVLYAELAAGLGETLASGTRGSPWRLSVDKHSGAVKVLAFANFSRSLGGTGGKAGAFGTSCLDYSKQALTLSEETRKEVGEKLADVGKTLEQAFGGAQDVEGALVDGSVYVVQTRPQP